MGFLKGQRSKLKFIVFSYNRGPYLEQCLKSIASAMGSEEIVVFDDKSDDDETLRVLDLWSDRVEISRPGNSPARDSSARGGLYQNMNSALEMLKNCDTEYAVFIQDDMQVVRPVTHTDVANFSRYFTENRNSLELGIHFSPYHVEGHESQWSFDASRVALISNHPNQRMKFSAVGLFEIQRVIEWLGNFASSEGKNTEAVRALQLSYGVLRAPFAMFMPFPETYRLGSRSVARRLAERLSGAGLHPYAPMEPTEIAALRERNRTSPPLAREWLRCPTLEHREIWSYYGGWRDVASQPGWRGWLGRRLGVRGPQLEQDYLSGP